MSQLADTEKRFHDAMLEAYERASRECGYHATRFLQMVRNRGGLYAAQKLLKAQGVSAGLLNLAECGRLDLFVEALVLKDKWRHLFTEEELEAARRRLADAKSIAEGTPASLSIDRLGPKWAVLEYPGTTFNVPRALLPGHAREGDVLKIPFELDRKDTEARSGHAKT